MATSSILVRVSALRDSLYDGFALNACAKDVRLALEIAADDFLLMLNYITVYFIGPTEYRYPDIYFAISSLVLVLVLAS